MRLMDQVTPAPRPWEWLVEAMVSGLLVLLGFAILERMGRGRRSGALA
jgi:hypothetical protein